MASGIGRSVSDKLLEAAFNLEESGRTPFTAEDLVVAAWRLHPDTFGLSGQNDPSGKPMFPDSNRVFAEIMGSKPIRKRGYLRKVGTKMYQLTEAGRERGRILATRPKASEIQKLSLARDAEAELQRLLTTRATAKYRAGRESQITFRDACSFWGINPRSSAIELEGRLSACADLIQRGLHAVNSGASTFKHGGTPVTHEKFEQLAALASYMEVAFTSELEVIRQRRDERS